MQETVRTRLAHALLSVLLSAGLVFPVLGILEPSFIRPAVIVPVLVTVMLFELASLKRVTAIASAAACCAGVLFWLTAAGGMITVSDVARAVSLRVAGIRSALPLVASQAILLITILLTLVSCFACLRSVSCFPASFLCVGLILLIYLTGSASVIPWALPALAALILLLMIDRFPDTSVLHVIP